MGLDSKNFIYSRNVLNPHTNNYAYYVYNNGFCFMDNTAILFGITIKTKP